MTIPQNVKDAIANVDACRLHTFDADWRTIRAHLLSQEAEIADLIGKRDFLLRHYNLAESRLAAANAQLRLMHRVLSQAVCVACADDGGAKDHELDKLEGVLRDQGWITSAVVPSAPIDAHPQGSGDEA